MLRTRAPSQQQHGSGGGNGNQNNNIATRHSPSQGGGPLSQQQPMHSSATQLADYQLLEKVGDGTFGTVILALCKTMNNTRIALKKMKTEYRNKDEGDREREVRTLRRLRHHRNIVRLYATFFENGIFYIAYEYMERNLLDLIRGVNVAGHQGQQQQLQQPRGQQSGLPEHEVRLIMYQVFAGIEHLHRHGYFHRDMKPENILCNGAEVVKICDFGLAKEVRSAPPFTTYISTRWYRAPELLLSALNYNTPIDIWACGCIMFECYTGNPLFPGKTDIDMVHKICARLGDPKEAEWPDGHKLIKKKGLKFPVCTPVNLALLFVENRGAASATPTNDSPSGMKSSSSVSADAVTLIRNILRWNPIKRIGAGQILRHAFFANVPAQLKSTQSDAAMDGTVEANGTSAGTSRTPVARQQQHRTVAESPGTKAVGSSRTGSGAIGGKKNSVVGDKRNSVVVSSSANARSGIGVVPTLPGRPLSPLEQHSMSGVDKQPPSGAVYKSARHNSKSGVASGTPQNSSIRNNSLTMQSHKSHDTLAAAVHNNNKRPGGSATNDTIYEYATSSDDAEAIIAAADQQRRNSIQQQQRFQSPSQHANGSSVASSGAARAVYHTSTTIDDNGSDSHYNNKESMLKLLDGTNAVDAVGGESNDNTANGQQFGNSKRTMHADTKLLDNLFRDIDEASTSAMNVFGDLDRRKHALPAPSSRDEQIVPTSLLERSKTTSPPKLLSRHQQTRYLYDKLFDAENGNIKQHRSPESIIKQQQAASNGNNNNDNNGRGAKFSLNDFISMTAPPTPTLNSTNSASKILPATGSRTKHSYAADLFNNGAPPLSLGGKRVALKKSSTEFSIRNFGLPPAINNNTNHMISSAAAVGAKPSFPSADFVTTSTSSSSAAFLPPVTADPLATLNDMLLLAGASTSAKSDSSQRPVAGSTTSTTTVGTGNGIVVNNKHSGTDLASNNGKKFDGFNPNGNIQQQHLTDWSRKYPQWK